MALVKSTDIQQSTEVDVITNLIIGAANGTILGVEALQAAKIPVELEEFEVEVTYAAETEVKEDSDYGIKFIGKIITAKVGHTRSSRNKATYGLKVRFLFSGKEPEKP